jgi:AraC-like DNA-binding protein
MSRLDFFSDWVSLAKNANYKAAKLAILCQVSESQLRRYFWLTFGQTPRRLLGWIKLCESARVLCATTKSVKFAAREVGFSDEADFSHQFKRLFGCSPSTFARRHRTDPATGLSRQPWEAILRQVNQKGKVRLGTAIGEKVCGESSALRLGGVAHRDVSGRRTLLRNLRHKL